MPVIKNGFLSVALAEKDLVFSVIDERTKKTWNAEKGLFKAVCYDLSGERTKKVGSSDKKNCRYTFQRLKDGRKLIRCFLAETEIEFDLVVTVDKDCFSINIPHKSIKEHNPDFFKLLNIELLPFFGGVKTGEDGYLFLPQYSGVICRFNKKEARVYRDFIYGSQSQWENFTDMPVFGIVHRQAALLGVVGSGEFDTEVVIATNFSDKKFNAVHPCFHYRYEQSDRIDPVDREVRYYFLSGREATYSGMAKR